eukprot:TRINITY_DN10926_c0_g1_i1.p1 TRINITY_DN10926_c0_g1~~TRINITY_DN10926_c0_g1_i1.p1  ORF type:complete len:297 (+),score=22.35 TRINITY_DN10926_c0_g1_i1:197-1087(+)
MCCDGDRPYVIGVTILITFLYSCFWIGAAVPWLWHTTTVGLLNIVLFSTIVGMTLFNYYLAVTTDPGAPPPDWIPPGATPEELQKARALAADSLFQKRAVYCTQCERFRPKRAFHCRVCKRCRLKMEHHCPFINNCVGHFNHKPFVLFLFYASVGLAYEVVVISIRIFDAVTTNSPPDASFLVTIIAFVTSFPVCSGVAFLFFHQTWSVIRRNTTGMEDSERSWAEYDARQQLRNYVWPHDRGVRANFEETLGPLSLLWFCPTRPVDRNGQPSDGLRWQAIAVNPRNGSETYVYEV